VNFTVELWSRGRMMTLQEAENTVQIFVIPRFLIASLARQPGIKSREHPGPVPSLRANSIIAYWYVHLISLAVLTQRRIVRAPILLS